MARAALSLQQKTSASASWLPNWSTCMCEISREDSMHSTQQLFSRWFFLAGSAIPKGRLDVTCHH
jgi:hypothetical protein